MKNKETRWIKYEKFTDKIKENKVKIGIGSAFFASIITIGTVSGVLTSVAQQDKTPSVTLPTVIPTTPPILPEVKPVKPGEIRFDASGKLEIPKMVDEENPSGIYENKITPITETKVSESFKKDEKAQKELKDLVAKNKLALFETINKAEIDLNQKIKIDDTMKKFIDVIIPGNKIDANVEIDAKTLLENSYEASTVNANQKILDDQTIRDYLALSGINFDKEYNNLMKDNVSSSQRNATLNFIDLNNLTLGLRGGGGKPNPNPQPPVQPPITQPTIPENKKTSAAQYLEVIDQDANIRFGFAIAYSIILPVLILISIIHSILSFGSVSVLLAADIFFSAYEIFSAWFEYTTISDLKILSINLILIYVEQSLLNGLNVDVNFQTNWYNNLNLWMQMKPNFLVEDTTFNKMILDLSWDKVVERGSKYVPKFKVKIDFQKNKFLTFTKNNFSTIKKIKTGLSAVVLIVMPLLEKILIKYL